VTCDCCMKSSFSGLRYKCLICFDYDLCQSCHDMKAVSSRHKSSHSMQCIPTRADMGILYSGEPSSSLVIQSFSCPHCSKMGFNSQLLADHVRTCHRDRISVEICPICASLPGGDANHVTDDLSQHISTSHQRPILELVRLFFLLVIVFILKLNKLQLLGI
ncbi:hypothetical protein HELRODRAFT_85566, partial [Helobdella robusta]|uniref:RING-type E3 ubiquitin transferase n=1 Tax=Helobdella robusta TaxID=6412 RepID=T1G5Z6_HELRO